MSKPSREDILRRIFQDDDGTESGFGGKLGQDDRNLDGIITGLVFAQRPIVAAAREILDQYNLGPRGSFILSLVANGVCYPRELASVLKIGRSLVTAELNRLIAAGLVIASPGQSDRRQSQLALTPVGEAASGAFRLAVFHLLQHNLRNYTSREIRLFAQMLKDVRKVEIEVRSSTVQNQT